MQNQFFLTKIKSKFEPKMFCHSILFLFILKSVADLIFYFDSRLRYALDDANIHRKQLAQEDF